MVGMGVHMDIIISIIVPVYNTEKYLKKCIDSIVNQKLSELEIILINDGSTDMSLNILRDYESKYDNIILINKENEGQGVARNKALDISRGNYIAFVDSDDFIEPNMLELMYNKIIDENLDMVISNYKYVNESGQQIKDNNIILSENEIIDTLECMKRFLITNTIEGFSCNKLFKKSLFDNIRYPANMKYEDIPTVATLIANSKRIGFINKKLYNYVIRKDSTTSSQTVINTVDYLKSLYMVGETINKFNIDNLLEEYEYYYSKRVANCVYGFLKTNNSKADKRNFIIYSEKYLKRISKTSIAFSNRYFIITDKIKIIIKILLLNIYSRKILK